MIRFLFGFAWIILFWSLAFLYGWVDNFLLPSPWMVGQHFATLLMSGILVPDIVATLGRVASVILWAVALGLPLGILLGSSEWLYRHVEGSIDFFRSIPATAMFPLFMLVFGIGDASKVMAAVFAAFFVVVFNTAHGIVFARKGRLRMARFMGATTWQRFTKVILWESLPQTFVGLRNATSLALVVVIVTEMFIGTSVGLGRRIVDFQIVYAIADMYAIIIMVGLLGYALNRALQTLEHRFLFWSGK